MKKVIHENNFSHVEIMFVLSIMIITKTSNREYDELFFI
jgi:hypothetical protein